MALFVTLPAPLTLSSFLPSCCESGCLLCGCPHVSSAALSLLSSTQPQHFSAVEGPLAGTSPSWGQQIGRSYQHGHGWDISGAEQQGFVPVGAGGHRCCYKPEYIYLPLEENKWHLHFVVPLLAGENPITEWDLWPRANASGSALSCAVLSSAPGLDAAVSLS